MTGHGRKGDKFKKGSKFTGLSLAKFIKAKKSTYDPREVKERERARAAITIAKYKKLKSRLQRASNISTGQQEKGEEEEVVLVEQGGMAAADDGGDREGEAAVDRQVGTEGPSKGNSKKRERQLELEKKKEEEAAAVAAKAADREAAIKRRKAEHKLLKKKTRHGQPVMKHRIEKMLQQLEKQ